RAGLGSKVSTCDQPPFMNRKITRLARAGKCDGFTSSGPCPAARRVSASASIPNPLPMNLRTSRRYINASLIQCAELARTHQDLRILRPGVLTLLQKRETGLHFEIRWRPRE